MAQLRSETQLRAQTDAMVENLVTQFADPFDALRELVQNSIDAGTSRIEVWTHFEASQGQKGTIEIHVDDFGEGMDETIIDNQFTRLFASTKDQDFTKIGKFGIGFVSVFALRPRAVLVHTGRGGEYWEVLFDHELNITKSVLDVPVEGTQITIFLEGDLARYEEVVTNSIASLKKWCVHSETEIVFENRSSKTGASPIEITERFTLPGPAFHQELPGTEVVMSFSQFPNYSFFNRGLTLATTVIADDVLPASMVPLFRGISVKMKSRYLEHTLSRDTIVKDAHYHNAMQILFRARLEMYRGLIKDIEILVSKEEWVFEDILEYSRLLERLQLAPDLEKMTEALEAKIFRTLSGRPVDPINVYERYDRLSRVFVSPQPDGIAEQVGLDSVLLGAVRTLHPQHPLGIVTPLLARLVEFASRRSWLGKVVDRFFPKQAAIQRAIVEPAQVLVAIVVVDPDALTRQFLAATLKLLRRVGFRYRSCSLFRPTQADAPFFLVAERIQPLMERPPERGDFQFREVAVNETHPHYQRLRTLYQTHPEVAIFCLSRCLIADSSRMAFGSDFARAIAVDERLLTAIHEESR